ncbi:MAG: hypothetical protein RBR65_06635 [Aliarcobacter sp.]|nr:hypothetical protein [Aliarcobacter sp.]
MNILLVCETTIIEHIFTLVCKRLNVKLSTQKNTNISENFDLIVIDQNFIDDKFNLIKQHSRKLGAISSEELSFDKARDFIIPRPFLPTKLESIIIDQMKYIKVEKEEESNKKISYEEDEDVTIPIVNYVDSLNDDENFIEKKQPKSIATNNEDDDYDEEDEGIVHLQTLKSGGILDYGELSKINDILRDDNIQNEMHLEKNDWKDISAIIDDALEEVKEYEFDLSHHAPIKPYNLVLSNFSINELRPLLEKFDQTVIDKLSSGEIVDVRMSLKEK